MNRYQRLFAMLIHRRIKIDNRRGQRDAQNDSEIKGFKQSLVLPLLFGDREKAA